MASESKTKGKWSNYASDAWPQEGAIAVLFFSVGIILKKLKNCRYLPWSIAVFDHGHRSLLALQSPRRPSLLKIAIISKKTLAVNEQNRGSKGTQGRSIDVHFSSFR